MDRIHHDSMREEAAQRFRDPQNWRSEALRLHRETGLSIVDIAKRVGVGKNRVGSLLRGHKRGHQVSTETPATALAQAQHHAGAVRVGGTFVRKVARGTSKADHQTKVDRMRNRLHHLLVSDQGRIVPQVTLPCVAILEGVDPS